MQEAAAAARRLIELKEAKREADALDQFQHRLEADRAVLSERKIALDQQLLEINVKARQLLDDRKELRKERLACE